MRINEDLEIEVLLDEPIVEAKKLMHKGTIAYSKLLGTGRNNINLGKIPVANKVEYGGYTVMEYENGSITIHQQGKLVSPAKPILREIATNLNISILNGNGNQHNTRMLGSLIIKAIITTQTNPIEETGVLEQRWVSK